MADRAPVILVNLAYAKIDQLTAAAVASNIIGIIGRAAIVADLLRKQLELTQPLTLDAELFLIFSVEPTRSAATSGPGGT